MLVQENTLLTGKVSNVIAISKRSITGDWSAVVKADQEGAGDVLFTQCFNII